MGLHFLAQENGQDNGTSFWHAALARVKRPISARPGAGNPIDRRRRFCFALQVIDAILSPQGRTYAAGRRAFHIAFHVGRL